MVTTGSSVDPEVKVEPMEQQKSGSGQDSTPAQTSEDDGADNTESNTLTGPPPKRWWSSLWWLHTIPYDHFFQVNPDVCNIYCSIFVFIYSRLLGRPRTRPLQRTTDSRFTSTLFSRRISNLIQKRIVSLSGLGLALGHGRKMQLSWKRPGMFSKMVGEVQMVATCSWSRF